MFFKFQDTLIDCRIHRPCLRNTASYLALLNWLIAFGLPSFVGCYLCLLGQYFSLSGVVFFFPSKYFEILGCWSCLHLECSLLACEWYFYFLLPAFEEDGVTRAAGGECQQLVSCIPPAVSGSLGTSLRQSPSVHASAAPKVGRAKESISLTRQSVTHKSSPVSNTELPSTFRLSLEPG